MADLKTKLSDQSKVYTFDFSTDAVVAGGDLLASVTSVTSGAGLTIGTPVLQGDSKTVKVKLSAGTPGTLYHILCECLTVSAEIVSICGKLLVKDC